MGLRRSPVSRFPSLHQIVLPTPWDVGPVQVYLVDEEPLTLIDTGVKSEASFGHVDLTSRSFSSPRVSSIALLRHQPARFRYLGVSPICALAWPVLPVYLSPSEKPLECSSPARRASAIGDRTCALHR